jgi:hypothetical protein
MSKLIYAEPDDEITNLVDRLRSEKTEKELVFVLPGGSRVLHSNLNARLLKQYSNSLGKSTSVISPDPRTQSIAIETGFSVFPTMTAFESGSAIDRAVDTGAVVQAGVLAPLPVQSGAFDSVAPQGRPAPPPPVAARTRPTPSAAAAEIMGGRAGYIPYVLGGIGVILIVFILFLFVFPSATVQIVIPARAISAQPTINGSTSPPGPGDAASVQTTIQQAQEQTQQQNVAATGQKTIPAVPATGTVVFTYTNPDPFTPGFDLPKGTEVTTDDGKKYTTQADSGTIGRNQSSPPIAISAENGGVAGNTPAGTIKNITGNTHASQLVVNNPSDVGGGVDATTKTVVAQTDLDKVKKALGDQLTTKVNADLAKSAGTQKLLAETLTIAVDASYDKKAGDEAANFNATVTVKGAEDSLDDAKVKQVLTEALRKQAPGGYTLTDNPLKLDYKLVQHDDKGGVVLNGTASGFMATAINKDDIRSHVTGKSIKQARAYIHGNIDSTNIIISESPSLVPWLPFIGGRIDVKTTVENPQPG